MTSPSLLDVDVSPGRTPVLRLDSTRLGGSWVDEDRDDLRAAAVEHGALIVRGLSVPDADAAAGLLRSLAGELMDDRESFAARTTYAPGVYSSTPWPANQQMCMHHELSYAAQAPGLMLFACLEAPSEGGATAVANATAVHDALPTDLVERFTRRGWLLLRTYNDDIGASYAEAFGTEDRSEVEKYCQDNGIELEWLADGGLRTRQRRPAVVRHPVSGAHCWFNQIAFLSQWTLDPEIRDYLVDEYGVESLPFNTAFGDGEPIDADVVALINATYDAATLREPWQAGDLLLVDNVATAHSREPYSGHREIVAAMADPVRPAELAVDAEGVSR